MVSKYITPFDSKIENKTIFEIIVMDVLGIFVLLI
jgi:hypothetical protein